MNQKEAKKNYIQQESLGNFNKASAVLQGSQQPSAPVNPVQQPVAAPLLEVTWHKFDIPNNIIDALIKNDFKTPSITQIALFDSLKKDKMKSGILEAPTGTGKTIAFLSHALRVVKPNVKKPQVIIFVHTQILGSQILNECQKLQKSLGIESSLLLGLNANLEFNSKAQIVISTPGAFVQNFIPVVKRGKTVPAIYDHDFQLIILDEADFYWKDSNMRENMCRVFGDLNRCQILLFSANLDTEIRYKIVGEWLKNCRESFKIKKEVTLENQKTTHLAQHPPKVTVEQQPVAARLLPIYQKMMEKYTQQYYQIHDLFPDFTQQKILSALDNNYGNVERAIDNLMANQEKPVQPGRTVQQQVRNEYEPINLYAYQKEQLEQYRQQFYQIKDMKLPTKDGDILSALYLYKGDVQKAVDQLLGNSIDQKEQQNDQIQANSGSISMQKEVKLDQLNATINTARQQFKATNLPFPATVRTKIQKLRDAYEAKNEQISPQIRSHETTSGSGISNQNRNYQNSSSRAAVESAQNRSFVEKNQADNQVITPKKTVSGSLAAYNGNCGQNPVLKEELKRPVSGRVQEQKSDDRTVLIDKQVARQSYYNQQPSFSQVKQRPASGATYIQASGPSYKNVTTSSQYGQISTGVYSKPKQVSPIEKIQVRQSQYNQEQRGQSNASVSSSQEKIVENNLTGYTQQEQFVIKKDQEKLQQYGTFDRKQRETTVSQTKQRPASGRAPYTEKCGASYQITSSGTSGAKYPNQTQQRKVEIKADVNNKLKQATPTESIQYTFNEKYVIKYYSEQLQKMKENSSNFTEKQVMAALYETDGDAKKSNALLAKQLNQKCKK